MLKYFFAATMIVAATLANAQEVKKLKAMELAVETSKWKDKTIETTMSCFYADKDEYRCVGSGARVDFEKISNPEGKKHLEDNCDTLENSNRDVCTVRIVFVYEDYHAVENGSRRLLMVSAKDSTGQVFPIRKR